MGWWVLLDSNGSVKQQVSCDVHPSESSAYMWPNDSTVQVDRKGTPLEHLVGGAWVEDPTKVERILLSQIDKERVDRCASILSPGETVKLAYQRKGEEVRVYTGMSSEEITALTEEERTTRFPWLMAEVTESGDSLETVASRIVQGMQNSEQQISQIEAKAVTAKRLIRNASTAQDKRDVFQSAWVANI